MIDSSVANTERPLGNAASEVRFDPLHRRTIARPELLIGQVAIIERDSAHYWKRGAENAHVNPTTLQSTVPEGNIRSTRKLIEANVCSGSVIDVASLELNVRKVVVTEYKELVRDSPLSPHVDELNVRHVPRGNSRARECKDTSAHISSDEHFQPLKSQRVGPVASDEEIAS